MDLDGFDENKLLDSNLGSFGVFDRVISGNLFALWSHVFVPYCTGDLHGGDSFDGTTNVHHVGYRNIGVFLQRLIPTFATAKKILLVGSSAGGFGVLLNYHRVQQAFANVAVYALDDSAPLLGDAFLTPKLQSAWRSAWNLNATLPAGCLPCKSKGLYHLLGYLATVHPSRRFALISSVGDLVIRQYLGYGLEPPQTMTSAQFSAGLDDLADKLLAPYANWHVYYISGGAAEQAWHVWLGSGTYTKTTVSGVKLIDWVNQMVQDDATWTNVRP
jgi:hypothetical protein